LGDGNQVVPKLIHAGSDFFAQFLLVRVRGNTSRKKLVRGIAGMPGFGNILPDIPSFVNIILI
jgi:hypothetical protein